MWCACECVCVSVVCLVQFQIPLTLQHILILKRNYTTAHSAPYRYSLVPTGKPRNMCVCVCVQLLSLLCRGRVSMRQFRDWVMLRMCRGFTITLFVRFLDKYYVVTIPKSSIEFVRFFFDFLANTYTLVLVHD